jgi:hypothetical protein
MYVYSDTYGFDLVVVFLVAVVMPMGVLLMQSRRAGKRAGALALMVASVCYIGIFEHYRLHRPEITRAGVRRTFFADSIDDDLAVDDGARLDFGLAQMSASGLDAEDEAVGDAEDGDEDERRQQQEYAKV